MLSLLIVTKLLVVRCLMIYSCGGPVSRPYQLIDPLTLQVLSIILHHYKQT